MVKQNRTPCSIRLVADQKQRNSSAKPHQHGRRPGECSSVGTRDVAGLRLRRVRRCALSPACRLEGFIDATNGPGARYHRASVIRTTRRGPCKHHRSPPSPQRRPGNRLPELIGAVRHHTRSWAWSSWAKSGRNRSNQGVLIRQGVGV